MARMRPILETAFCLAAARDRCLYQSSAGNCSEGENSEGEDAVKKGGTSVAAVTDPVPLGTLTPRIPDS